MNLKQAIEKHYGDKIVTNLSKEQEEYREELANKLDSQHYESVIREKIAEEIADKKIEEMKAKMKTGNDEQSEEGDKNEDE